MIVAKNLMNYDNSTSLVLTFDFDRLRLQFEGDPACEVDETFETIEAMEAAFRDKIWFTNLLRERLNTGLGAEARTLHCAVFMAGDSGITGVVLDGPLLAGKTREEIEAAVAEHPHGGWAGDGGCPGTGYNLEYEGNFDPLEDYGEPSNLYDDGPQRLFHLACARLERDPKLRPNVTIASPFRVFWNNHDETTIAWGWRETAEAFVGRPAREYFDATCRPG